MTALNVLVRPDAAVIVTDSKAVAPGQPPFDTAKVMPIPHMHLAIATRGPMESVIKVVGAVCVGAKNYDEARAFLDQAYGQLGLAGVEIVVAGWGSKGPAAFIVSDTNTAGRVVDIERALVTPTVSPEAFDEFAADPIAGMPKLLERQAAGNECVGGFMNVCQVGQTVIESYTAGRIGWRPGMAA